MDAFLTRYEASLPPALREAQRAFWVGWNDGNSDLIATTWPATVAALPALRRHAHRWADLLAAHDDLATVLVKYCENRL